MTWITLSRCCFCFPLPGRKVLFWRWLSRDQHLSPSGVSRWPLSKWTCGYCGQYKVSSRGFSIPTYTTFCLEACINKPGTLYYRGLSSLSSFRSFFLGFRVMKRLFPAFYCFLWNKPSYLCSLITVFTFIHSTILVEPQCKAIITNSGDVRIEVVSMNGQAIQ